MDYPTHGQQRKDTSDGQGFVMSTLWPLWGPTVCNGTDLMSSPGFETLVGLLLVLKLDQFSCFSQLEFLHQENNNDRSFISYGEDSSSCV